MAAPPFNLDIGDPTDTGIGDLFPANERAFRDNINSYINIEHDINSGHHAIPSLSGAARDAIVNWPIGALCYNTDAQQLQVQTAAGAPFVWRPAGNIRFQGTTAPGSSPYATSIKDDGALIQSGSAGGALTVTLPSTTATNLLPGWTIMLMQIGGNAITVNTSAISGGNILAPDAIAVTTVSLFNGNNEYLQITFDGNNFVVTGGSPNTLSSINSTAALVPDILTATNAALTVKAPNCKLTVIGGGGGGGGGLGAGGSGGGGGAGGQVVAYLRGLTTGNTLNVTVASAGAGGAVGAAGSAASGDTSVASGTQTISTITGGAGSGGAAGTGSNVAGGAGGSTLLTITGVIKAGFAFTGQAGGAGGAAAISGVGASTILGAGGYSFGDTGEGFGSGGAGGGTNQAGAAGAVACAIFEWGQ